MSLTIIQQQFAYQCNDGSGSRELHSGGIDRASRRNRVISAALAEPLAASKCQFSGITGACRLSFRREWCKFVAFTAQFAVFAIIQASFSPKVPLSTTDVN